MYGTHAFHHRPTDLTITVKH